MIKIVYADGGVLKVYDRIEFDGDGALFCDGLYVVPYQEIDHIENSDDE